MVAGTNLEQTIQQLMDMGGGSWDRETVRRALRAAFNNPERAVDYLYSVCLICLGTCYHLGLIMCSVSSIFQFLICCVVSYGCKLLLCREFLKQQKLLNQLLSFQLVRIMKQVRPLPELHLEHLTQPP